MSDGKTLADSENLATPLTDAVAQPAWNCYSVMVVKADFARDLERKLAELQEQNRVFRIAQKACEDCEGMSHLEFEECKKDSERLDKIINIHNFPLNECYDRDDIDMKIAWLEDER